MATPQLLSHRQGQTLVLTLSNPDMRNALGPEIYAQGLSALREARLDAGVRSVILTGEGATFCAGGNLQRLQANRALSPDVQAQSIDLLHGFTMALREFPKPIIAAVEGAAAGAGFSLALVCDFIVAADNAIFLMAYSNIAISPDGGGSWSLAQTLPRQLVNQLLMCGERISAERLHALGVVNQVTPAGQALEKAHELAHKLNERAPNALASAKQLVTHALDTRMQDHLDLERGHFVRNLHHANGGEGIAAFLEKRKPSYE